MGTKQRSAGKRAENRAKSKLELGIGTKLVVPGEITHVYGSVAKKSGPVDLIEIHEGTAWQVKSTAKSYDYFDDNAIDELLEWSKDKQMKVLYWIEFRTSRPYHHIIIPVSEELKGKKAVILDTGDYTLQEVRGR